MSILKTAISARRWDLAAHALVYALISQNANLKSQNTGGNLIDCEENPPCQRTEAVQERKAGYGFK